MFDVIKVSCEGPYLANQF